MNYVTDKEKLTQATMDALQGKLKDNVDAKTQNKNKLKKVIECYSEQNELMSFIDLLVEIIDEITLSNLLQGCEEQKEK